ncbi:ABC transporter permease [Microbacterium sp. SORGH_AS_0888]|uniref:ABC transporter permease n=1 Tax=Microbacterium sp. SORGH_AS_0888 TaxID=3041791 RepID=UPI0027890C74|nr:ABC transporter permease [Microbacterium sp. SORGH_AS_0888]MDQ1130568.1 fructose transport system permease protein [Microbacterium sp. SORGH_AS_0888]
MSETTATPPPTSTLDLANEFINRQTPMMRVRSVLHRYPAISPAAVLIVAIVVFGIINPRFLAPANLSLITQQVAVIGALGVAQTLVILTAGIDLSVGAAMVFSSIVMGNAAAGLGLPGPVALLLGLVVGFATGALNGFLVTRVNLPPFIVTLGTLSIFTALTLLTSNGATVQGVDLPDLLTWTGSTVKIFGVDVTFGVMLMLLIYLVMSFVLARTAWGRHVYAVGDDKEAARLSGIRVTRVLLSVYLTAGVIVGLAAWIQIGRDYGASPNAAVDANLNAITAVVIGGTSLFGGRGNVWGTLLGALIVGVFRNGLALAGLDVLYQTLAVGVLVIVAVSIDQWIRKVRK